MAFRAENRKWKKVPDLALLPKYKFRLGINNKKNRRLDLKINYL